MKFGPFLIQPGLTRGNVVTVLFASFVTVALIVFKSIVQPYVLNELVQVPVERQGSVTGMLTLLHEVVTVLLVGFIGASSDRVGRRRVYTVGFLVMAVGYAIYPLAASEGQLYLFRMVFALGATAAAVMLSTVVQDTPQEISRGKWVASNNVLQGLGVLALATALLSQLPAWYATRGYDAVMAGRLTFWTVTGVAVFAALVMRLGLAPRRERAAGAVAERSVFREFFAGLAEGRSNPRLALAFGAAFIGRGDLVVVGSFLTLWITQSGIEQGMTTAESVAQAGKIFGLVQLSALLWAYFMGMIMDRLQRTTGLCIALALAAVGYTLMGTMDDPFGLAIIPAAILLGIGEVSVIVGGGALLGQEARSVNRGAVVGAYNLVGGIGIMFAGYFGGQVFDAVDRTAPFLFIGILNGVLMLFGLAVRAKYPVAPPGVAAAGSTG